MALVIAGLVMAVALSATVACPQPTAMGEHDSPAHRHDQPCHMSQATGLPSAISVNVSPSFSTASFTLPAAVPRAALPPSRRIAAANLQAAGPGSRPDHAALCTLRV